MLSQWQLIWRKFRRHHLARLGGITMGIILLLAVFCEFFGPYGIYDRRSDHVYAPPTRVRIWHEGRLHRPFVYGLTRERSPLTLTLVFEENRSEIYPVRLFLRGSEYKLIGLIPTDVHFFGVDEPGVIYLFGTENLGRDMFSRVLSGARVSLSVGIVGIMISFVIGCLIGGLTGYYGGMADMIAQRVIEIMQGIPQLPLWISLGAAIPLDWPIIRVYFMITIILSILGWTGLARTVRSKLLAVRTEDYVMAAKIAGANELRIVVRHMLPSFASYLIVSLTMSVPYMILGETSLSFLGLGLRPPAVSWGVLLQQAQNIRAVSIYPWLMIPGLWVVVVVLAFNFLGDGLRDAADPYK